MRRKEKNKDPKGMLDWAIRHHTLPPFNWSKLMSRKQLRSKRFANKLAARCSWEWRVIEVRYAGRHDRWMNYEANCS